MHAAVIATGNIRIGLLTTRIYLVCLGLRGNRERDPAGSGVSAEGLRLQISPHLVLPRARQPPLTRLRPLHLLGKAVPIQTCVSFAETASDQHLYFLGL